MKIKHLMITSCLFTAFTLQSCIEEKNLYQEPPTTYSDLNLKLDGDYLITELPMSRSTKPTVIDESKTIVGIAISMLIEEGKNTSSKPYAYGIFQLDKAKNPENLKIRVIDGYKYRVACSMIANAKDSIKMENGGFAAPFDLERNGTIKGECQNKFLTAEQTNGVRFLYNIENSKIKTGSQDACNRPFIERYHGFTEIDAKDKQEEEEHPIMLYRRFFGVKFKQTGLESGRLRIRLDDSPSIYLDAANGDIHQTVESELKMVSMKNLTAKVSTEKNQNLTENVRVVVCWEKTPNELNDTIINSNITFKRNYIHNIALTNIDHIGTPGNVGIEIEEGEMQEDPSQDLPWQGDNFQ